METVQMRERTKIMTSVGELTPSCTFATESRKKGAAVGYYSCGKIKSLPLEDAEDIKTPLGVYSGELVTFYKSGNLRRLFPLNGRINAYWTEKDEYDLAEILDIPTPLGTLAVKPIYIQFYETGELHSVSFWPGEVITLSTPIGQIPVRKGITFHKNGNISSCEPAEPILVPTTLGAVQAYDPDPEGITADSGSLGFDDQGQVASVSTVKNRVVVNKNTLNEKLFSPKLVYSYCDESAFSVLPLIIHFEKESTCFSIQRKPAGKISLFEPAILEDFVHSEDESFYPALFSVE